MTSTRRTTCWSVTGESNAAPGTDVQIRLRATGEDPFLMSQTVEVQEDGSIEAAFDLSDHQADQEFTVTMVDGDVQDRVNAILVESADDDRYSDSKKGDDKQNDRKNDEKQDTGNDDSDDNNEQPGFGIVVALIALLAAAGFALRRQ